MLQCLFQHDFFHTIAIQIYYFVTESGQSETRPVYVAAPDELAKRSGQAGNKLWGQGKNPKLQVSSYFHIYG